MQLKRTLAIALIALGGCRPAPEPELRMTATIKDIMDSMIDPSGDFMFAAVAEIGDENGVTQKAPKTDEEWDEVRHRAFVLVEGMNLLMMPGRKVALPGQKSKFPEVELQPEEIQKKIDADRASLIRRARRLQDAGTAALKAAEEKDTASLFKSIEDIDKACENCHLNYWYPNDKRALEEAKKRGVLD